MRRQNFLRLICDRVLFALFIALFLQGCGSGTVHTADSDISLDPADDRAIVVIGLRSNSVFLNSISMTWREFDPALGFFKDTSSDGTQITLKNAATGFDKRKTILHTKYLAFEVKSGPWVLESYSLYAHPDRYKIKPRPNTLFIKVNKGEVLYIGNYYYESKATAGRNIWGQDYPIYHYISTKLRPDGEDLKSMKAFLAKNYENLTGPVSYRPPTQKRLELK